MVAFVRAAHAVLIVLCMCTVGCQFRAADPKLTPNVTFVLPGLDGPGPWYGSLIGGLREGAIGEQVELIAWGAPLSVLPNLIFSPLHDAAERRLADRIAAWREVHPEGRISLVGHSAGCGVILGGLRRLAEPLQVDNVLLLAPAVSDDYALSQPLKRVRGTMHVFYSGQDGVLPSTFVAGTYDGGAGDSAGRGGFETDTLPPELQTHLRQHPHRKEWASLGCGGGHFGWRAKPFVTQVLVPLLSGETSPPLAVRHRQPLDPAAVPARIVRTSGQPSL